VASYALEQRVVLSPEEIPDHFKWDLWLGPARFRPYNSRWLNWHTWRDFATGQLGNWGSHSANLAFMALKVHDLWLSSRAAEQKPKICIEAKCSGINRLSWDMTFDPSADQVGRILSQMNESIARFLEGATREQRSAFRELQRDLEQAGEDVQQIKEIWTRMSEASGGSRSFRSNLMRGDRAGPGEYRVTMTVDGRTYTSALRIRRDPLLEKGGF